MFVMPLHVVFCFSLCRELSFPVCVNQRLQRIKERYRSEMRKGGDMTAMKERKSLEKIQSPRSVQKIKCVSSTVTGVLAQNSPFAVLLCCGEEIVTQRGNFVLKRITLPCSFMGTRLHFKTEHIL